MPNTASILFNNAKKEYYYADSGNKVSNRNLTKRHIKQINANMRWSNKLVNKLTNKEIGFLDFQRLIATKLKDYKIESLELGKGGKENTFAIDYLNQARQLKDYDYPGLKKLFQEISEGKHSPKMIKARLHNFWKSGRQAFEYGRSQRKLQKAHTHCIRHLAIADHCEDCIRYAQLGIQPIGSLPLPTENCRCTYNCKCSYITGTFSDLVKRYGLGEKVTNRQ